MKQLSEFNDERIFIDTNIFIYFFRLHLRYSGTCKQFFSQMIDGIFKGYTSMFVIEEVLYILLIRAINDDFDGHPIEIIRDNPDIIKNYLDKLHHVITVLLSMDNLMILDTTTELIFPMIDQMQHGLLTRDALYVAAMDKNHISHIASFDTDFDRVDHIARWGI